jgi:ABC-type transport system substrate-binding protein
MKKIMAVLLAGALALGLLAGCMQDTPVHTTQNRHPDATTGHSVVYQPVDPADAVAHTDHTSVYEAIGSEITIDMVQEDTATGLAYVTHEGTNYELGLDFLSHAMVNNCDGAQETFQKWWKLYIQRWNYLVPQAPLYTGQCFDLYSAKLENFVTSPYWTVADAMVAASVQEESAVTLAYTQDLQIQKLVTGHSLWQTDKHGAFLWNEYALAQTPAAVRNEDGTLTYTFRLKEDLVFSDGSPIAADNYIAGILANSTEVAVAAGSAGTEGQALVGYEAFRAHLGEGEKVFFQGVKWIDDYSFAVTFAAQGAQDYFLLRQLALTPAPLELYLGENDIVIGDDGAVGLSDGFYEKDEAGAYIMAEIIQGNLKWDAQLPGAGPYVVSASNASGLTLTRNPNYPGDTARGSASIETITYVQVPQAQLWDLFRQGKLDVLPGITGTEETREALALVNGDPTRFAENHYNCAGYAALSFRGDFGPTSMVEVRQAILYTIDRTELAQILTGGNGTVVHGPYDTGYGAYQAVESQLVLNSYAYSVDNAKAVLEAGGWIYNDKGETYNPEVDAVRYKKLSGYELTRENLNFKTVDGKYATLKIDGAYYMPLAINWFGTVPSRLTQQLLDLWQGKPEATAGIGMHITYTSCDYDYGYRGEMCRDEAFGYDGTPKLNAIDLEVTFASAVYDERGKWTIDPERIAAGESVCYLLDEADYLENYR